MFSFFWLVPPRTSDTAECLEILQEDCHRMCILTLPEDRNYTCCNYVFSTEAPPLLRAHLDNAFPCYKTVTASFITSEAASPSLFCFSFDRPNVMIPLSGPFRLHKTLQDSARNFPYFPSCSVQTHSDFTWNSSTLLHNIHFRCYMIVCNYRMSIKKLNPETYTCPPPVSNGRVNTERLH